MTGEVRKLLNKRFKLLQSAKPTPKGSNEWKLYKQSRNKASNAIKTAKAKYWKKEFQNSDSSKSFWKTVRKFNGDTIKSTIGPLMDKNEVIVTIDKEKAELMNDFFANIGKELASEIGPIDTTTHNHIYRVAPTISEIKTDFNLFDQSFSKTVKTGKACGLDEISARDLKMNSSASSSGLYQVLKCSIENGKFPT